MNAHLSRQAFSEVSILYYLKAYAKQTTIYLKSPIYSQNQTPQRPPDVSTAYQNRHQTHSTNPPSSNYQNLCKYASLLHQLILLVQYLRLSGVVYLTFKYLSASKLLLIYYLVSIRLIVMKDSACGRIVSQRKIQNSLLREYDTKTTINISRINELKQKYNKNQTRTPLKGLINNTTQFSQFANQIKQKYIATETNVMKQDVSTHINEYKRKANQTNNTINQKLNYIEEELNRWKNQKEAKQQKQLRQFKERQYVREALDIKISASRQSKIQLPESMKVSMIENQPQTSVVQKMIDAKLDAKLHAGKKVDESDCKLLGEFKKQRLISKQFTIFINRLKDQISLDIDFTQIMLSLPAKDRNAVKQFIRHNYPSADVQFFTISPIEQDPLQTEAKVRYGGSIQSISCKLHEFYVKIQEHFRLKLLRNFDLETIETLFEEIGVKQMTLGHLISYINMRTGKQFRNRALVKLLRRLDICSHIIDRKQFTKGFVKL